MKVHKGLIFGVLVASGLCLYAMMDEEHLAPEQFLEGTRFQYGDEFRVLTDLGFSGEEAANYIDMYKDKDLSVMARIELDLARGKIDLRPIMDRDTDWDVTALQQALEGDFTLLLSEEVSGYPLEAYIYATAKDSQQPEEIIARTLLFQAAGVGHDLGVRRLSRFIDINQPGGVATVSRNNTTVGESALLLAARAGQENIVDLLINELGVDVNVHGKYNMTPLMWASQVGNSDVVDRLLQEGGIETDVRNTEEGGDTALMLASQFGHDTIVESLLEAGANPDIQNAGGITALMMVVLNAEFIAPEKVVTMAKALIEAGNPNIRNNYGETALMIAVGEGREEVVNLLLTERVAENVDLNAQNQNGDTALLYAIMQENVPVAEGLLRAGADPTIANDLDFNAYTLAKRNQDDEMLELLEKYRQASTPEQ